MLPQRDCSIQKELPNRRSSPPLQCQPRIQIGRIPWPFFGDNPKKLPQGVASTSGSMTGGQWWQTFFSGTKVGLESESNVARLLGVAVTRGKSMLSSIRICQWFDWSWNCAEKGWVHCCWRWLLSLQQFHLKVFRGGYVLLKGLARLTCIYETRQSCSFLISKFLQVWKPMDCLTYVGLIWPPLVVLVEIHRNDMCDVSMILMKSLSLCPCIGSAKVSSDALCSPTLPWLKQGFQVHVELCKAVAWTWKTCDFPPLKFTKVGILRTCNSFPFFWCLFLVPSGKLT